MNSVSIPVAFFSGIVSFFAPCVLPLLPVYVSYITGVTASDVRKNGLSKYRRVILESSLLYILGFSIVFVLLGVTAAGIGTAFRLYAREFQIFSGLLLIIFGAEFSGLLNLEFLSVTKKLNPPVWLEKVGALRAFVLGIIFALTWTPCIGAVLGAILALAAVSGSTTWGAFLLFTYSLGISLPFLIVSMTLVSAPHYLKWIQNRIVFISRFAGGVLILLGILLITGYYAHVNAFLFNLAFSLGYEIR